MPKRLPISTFVEAIERRGIDVAWDGTRTGADRLVTSAELHRPGLSLVGHFYHHHPDRIQVLGETEMTFLASRSPAERLEVLSRLADEDVPAFVVTRGLDPGDELRAASRARGVPLLCSQATTGDFIRTASIVLSDLLAESAVMHGVMVDVLGVGVLILGPSGIGKSECALELLMRGHRLVADDMVEVRRIKPGTLVCRSMELIKHHMEIRGLGIINVQDLFGVASVRDQKQLELIVELEAWDPEAYYDRVGTDPVRRKEILGLEIDVVSIPVRPGRNLSDVIEVAARNRILKIRGVDSARRFQQKLLDEIAAAQPRRQRQESLETGE